MKIYTRKGDDGTTRLIRGGRVSKASTRVQVYGNIDELNSAIGLARAFGDDSYCDRLLLKVQNQLMNLSAELACGGKLDASLIRVSQREIKNLEDAIDALARNLPPLKSLILPAGTRQAVLLHMARTVCRRAERDLVALAAKERVRQELIRYFNRLGDLLFVMARHANHRVNVEETPWKPQRSKCAKKNRGEPID